MAYVLLCALRRIALEHNPIGQSHLRHNPPQTLNIGALVRTSGDYHPEERRVMLRTIVYPN